MDDSWRETQIPFEMETQQEVDLSDPGKNISEDLVVTKYKMAGEIVNRVLQQVVVKCVVDASVREICEFGDKLMAEETGKVFKKAKEIKKGIAFPTCISVNNCINNFSPTQSEPDYVLKPGDVVKIKMAGHVDGFIASVGHTVVLRSGSKVTGRTADVILAAHYASEGAIRLLKPGNSTYAITDVVQHIARTYNCKPVNGILSPQLKQHEVDLRGGKCIILNPKDDDRKSVPSFDIETHEVYALDIVISTGEGTSREMDSRITIYKKVEKTYYQLKLKASRNVLNEIDSRFGSMPFNLRQLEDEKKAKLGLVECLKHDMIIPFRVMYEKPGEIVAQFEFTVLLMPNGPHKITGLPFRIDDYHSEYSYANDFSINELLNQSINLRTFKKKKQKLIRRGINGKL